MVRRPALTRIETLVVCAVLALLTGMLARTVQRVYEYTAQAEARAAVEQTRPAAPSAPAVRPVSAQDEDEDIAAQAPVLRRTSYNVGFRERRQP